MGLGFQLPNQSDHYDVAVFNNNFEKVDSKFTKLDNTDSSYDKRIKTLETTISKVDQLLKANVNVQQNHDEVITAHNEVVNIATHFQTKQNAIEETLASLRKDTTALQVDLNAAKAVNNQTTQFIQDARNTIDDMNVTVNNAQERLQLTIDEMQDEATLIQRGHLLKLDDQADQIKSEINYTAQVAENRMDAAIMSVDASIIRAKSAENELIAEINNTKNAGIATINANVTSKTTELNNQADYQNARIIGTADDCIDNINRKLGVVAVEMNNLDNAISDIRDAEVHGIDTINEERINSINALYDERNAGISTLNAVSETNANELIALKDDVASEVGKVENKLGVIRSAEVDAVNSIQYYADKRLADFDVENSFVGIGEGSNEFINELKSIMMDISNTIDELHETEMTDEIKEGLKATSYYYPIQYILYSSNRIHETNYDNEISRLEDWTKYYRALLKNEWSCNSPSKIKAMSLSLTNDSYILSSMDQNEAQLYQEMINDVISAVDTQFDENEPDLNVLINDIDLISKSLQSYDFDQIGIDQDIFTRALSQVLFSNVLDVITSIRYYSDNDKERIIPFLNSLHKGAEYTEKNFISIYLSDLKEVELFALPRMQLYLDEIYSSLLALPRVRDNYEQCTTYIPSEITKEDIENIIPLIINHRRDATLTDIPYKDITSTDDLLERIELYLLNDFQEDRVAEFDTRIDFLSFIEMVAVLKALEL